MTRQDLIHKWAVYALALLPVWLLDSCILPRFPLFGVTPMLLPLALTAVAVLEGSGAGGGFGLAVGVLCDAVYFGTRGAMTLGLCLLCCACGAAAQYALNQGFWGCLLCSAAVLAVIDAGRILAEDAELRRRFDSERIATMREAVEDHRASSGHAPRSIYGRIVAEADRCIDTQTILRRTVQYGLAHCPALTREEHFARCREHLQRKYAEGGYLRLWLPESDNARRLAELREAIRDRERLRRLFDAIFDAETSGSAGGTPDRTEAGEAAEAR